MTSNELYDLIIVGGGPSGLSAGIYAMRAALKTLLIEKGIAGGQMNLTEEVENYPGFNHISGIELSMKFSEHANAYNLEVLNQEVMAVDPGLTHHSVRLADSRTIDTCAVIIATGGSPRKLNIRGEDKYYGKGVSYCAVCDGFFFRNKTVMVIGGGDSACEEALYLAKITKKVYLVHRRDALRASRILQQRVAADAKIEVLWNTVITEIKADQEGVNSTMLQDTQTAEQREMPIDGVFIFIGFKPNNQLVPAGTRMNPEGFVITDNKCETNIPGIYAIGDLRDKPDRQIVLSAADGCQAALAAAHFVELKKAEMAKHTCSLPSE